MSSADADALWLLKLCDRFHKLPEEILAGDAQLLELLTIEGRWGNGQRSPDQGQGHSG